MPVASAPRLLDRILGRIERIGNALPDPATLFAALAILTLIVSAVAGFAQLSVAHPATGAPIVAVNLLTLEGLHRIISQMVPITVGFHPLGVVLVALLGIGVAERTGLIGALVRALVLATPRRFVTPIVILAGVLSNLGADVGYVLLIPLGAAIFHAVGRHPLAGLAAAFAGVSGGFSANLVVSAIDVILASLTQAAAQLIDPDYIVTGVANYFFLIASTVVVLVVGTWVTHRIVEPRLGPYTGNVPVEPLQPLAAAERRGLWVAAIFSAIFAAVVVAGVAPDGGFLRNPAKPDSLLDSLLLTQLVPFIFFYALGAGLLYGAAAGTVKNDKDVVKGMNETMSTLGAYLVLAFFAAQFIAYFNWSNLGLILAVKGAASFQALGLQDWPVPMMLGLVLLSAAINLVIGSASAKWALIAPIFVPMFMLLGFSPELVQAAYRIGDSCTNIVTPLMAYFPLVLTFARRYDGQTGMGTLIATMVPYSLAFLVVWSLLLIGWIMLGLPLGPGAALMIEVGS